MRLPTIAVLLACCLLPSPSGAATAAAGEAHVLVVAPDGTVWAWGRNSSGQLGDHSTEARLVPTPVDGLNGVTAVAAGSNHSLALTSGGSVWAWGWNGDGQLGDGTTATQREAPVQVPGLTAIVAIAAGRAHSLALKADGTVWAWGANASGQLGNNSTASSNVPIQVSGLAGIAEIAAGDSHSLARGLDGALRVWGGNASGQLGDGTTTTRKTAQTLTTISGVRAIAAGRTFSVVAKADGTVWAWGANSQGQLGDGTTILRRTPGQVSTLTDIQAVAAGDDHAAAVSSTGDLFVWGGNGYGQLGDGSYQTRTTAVSSGLSTVREVVAAAGFTVALTTDNGVWAWGRNAESQLGDGTTATLTSPAQIAAAGGVWCVAAPEFSISEGTYEADEVVLITSATTDATIHYTTDGAEPTTSSPSLPVDGLVTLHESVTLRARTFKGGLPASRLASAIYTLQVARPEASPEGGRYGTPKVVTLRTRTAGATLRYTVDGSEPTVSSFAYATPIAIDQSTTLRVKGFRSGVSPSEMLERSFVLEVSPPLIAPKPGLYRTSPLVTLSAPAGSVLYYTTDGSEPTLASIPYTGPIATTGPASTIRARAFRTGWSASVIVSGVYQTGTDSADPTIRARIEPAPNAAGWNRGPVTVFFDCRDDFAEPLTCTPPVVLSTAGAGQIVTGAVEDGAGHTASTSITVNIDLAPATITIDTPLDGSTTSVSSVTITGTVSDILSDLAMVSCNAAPVTVASGGTFSCEVPLGKGRNAVLVQARDVAGNHTSAAVRVTRTGMATSLSVSPGARAIVVGEETPLLAIDDFGVTSTGATWDTSDASVAAFDLDTPGLIRGISPGTVTVTATEGSISAEATIVVAAGPGLTAGTMLWTAPAPLSSDYRESVWAHRVNADDPDTLVLDSDGANRVVRGLRNGREVSRDVVPIDSQRQWIGQFVGDTFGGALLQVGTGDCIPNCTMIMRTGGSAGTWTYAAGDLSEFVQNMDGDVFVFETTDVQQEEQDGVHYLRSWTNLVRLDGRTGAVIAEAPLPRSHREGWLCEWNQISDEAASRGRLIVDGDGAARVLLRAEHYVSEAPQCDTRISRQNLTLQLLTMPSTGSVTVATLEQSTDSYSSEVGPAPEPNWPRELTPDDQGGLLASGESFGFAGGTSQSLYITSTGHQRLAVDFVQPPLVGRDGIAFGVVDDSGSVGAVDLAGGSVLWTSSTVGQPIAALTEGGVATLFDDTILQIDRLGATTRSTAFATVDGAGDPIYWALGEWRVPSWEGTITGVVGPVISDETYAYVGALNAQRQRQPRKPAFLTIVPIDPAPPTVTGANAVFRLTDTANLSASKVEHTLLNYDNVTAKKLLEEVAKPFDAIGYVGHTILPQSNQEALGLILAGNHLLMLETDRGTFADDVTTYVDHIETNTKVIFLAGCSIGPKLRRLWNVDGTTTERTLVAANTIQTRLGVGFEVWRVILDELMNGKRLNVAVKLANQKAATGWSLPEGQSEHEQWTITGGDPCDYLRRTAQTGTCNPSLDVLAWRPSPP